MQIINIKKYLWQILKLPQIPEFDPEHYGFTHQFDKEIKTIGYATNLNEETVDQAIKDKVDFGITPEPRPDNIKGYYCKLVGKINQPTSLEKLSNEISQILEVETQSWQFNPDNTNKICFASGGGAMTNDLKDAKEAGCDTYITGEVNMYTCELARFYQINLISCTHTFSELPGVASLVNRIKKEYPDLNIVQLTESKFEIPKTIL